MSVTPTEFESVVIFQLFSLLIVLNIKIFLVPLTGLEPVVSLRKVAYEATAITTSAHSGGIK